MTKDELAAVILRVCEAQDGLCMDVPAERRRLAQAIADGDGRRTRALRLAATATARESRAIAINPRPPHKGRVWVLPTVPRHLPVTEVRKARFQF